jgi:hypothetical protein
VHPLVLGVVLEAVVGPAADLDLLDLEVVALDRLLLADLTGSPHVGDVGAHPVHDRDDVRHAARQLAQHGHQLGRGPPRGHLARRCVDQRLVEDHRPVGGDHHGAPLEGAGLAALVALQHSAADGLDDRLGGTLLGEPVGDPADAQVEFGVGVLGGVRDVGADGGERTCRGEHRLQEGHVHGGGLAPRFGRTVPCAGHSCRRRLPTDRCLTPGVGSEEQG